MTDLALPQLPTAVLPIEELRRRQPALAALGLAYLILFAVVGSLPLIDGRMLDGVSVWAKPAKFFLSTSALMLSSAWFFGYVRPERRRAPALKWGVRAMIAGAVFELGYITLQAGLGQPSHFNRGDALHYALYGLMGFAATAMLLTKIPLGVEIARRPIHGLDPAFRRAVVIGLGLTVALGLASGVYMSQQYGSGHNVGAVGGAASFVGWNRAGGDLRVAHFFGMHGEQIVPAVAAVAGLWAGQGAARRATYATAAAIVAMTVFVFAQALMGRPFMG
ncbi:hypothetical protein [Methylopila sp. M107]|uniref:hypothetical protein n=1 Tax=Methylopila sp. M107 TaxID=1101190 RepID=UPI000372EDF8|nr:hypothetical protein [Methylopila sp. M107]